MHIYNVKAALRDKFYGEPTILYGTPKMDARALAALLAGVTRLRALDGRHYWYFFVKDIKNRDTVRFLMRRNGLRPKFHMSEYYAEPLPAFRVPLSDVVNSQHIADFTNQIKDAYTEDDKLVVEMARYVDTVKTKLENCKNKSK